MITINVTDLPILTAEDAEYETGVEAFEFSEPGLYRVLIGSRNEIDELEFMGDVATFELPTLEEVRDQVKEEWGQDWEDLHPYLEEFYNHELTERGYEFGYTEEGYDVFIRIG